MLVVCLLDLLFLPQGTPTVKSPLSSTATACYALAVSNDSNVSVHSPTLHTDGHTFVSFTHMNSHTPSFYTYLPLSLFLFSSVSVVAVMATLQCGTCVIGRWCGCCVVTVMEPVVWTYPLMGSSFGQAV